MWYIFAFRESLGKRLHIQPVNILVSFHAILESGNEIDMNRHLAKNKC